MAQARVFQRTEGHPLFIVETGRMGLPPPGEMADALPPRVQAVVAARLVQLSAEARGIAELAAVTGRDFSFGVLAHVSDLEEDAVVRALDELWRRQIIRVRSADRWDFSHDRIREVAYGGIGPVVRHPIMLGFIVAFWAVLRITAGHVLFAVAATAYILIALQFEERDLANYYGQAYERYREQTPMLIPLPKRDAGIVASQARSRSSLYPIDFADAFAVS